LDIDASNWLFLLKIQQQCFPHFLQLFSGLMEQCYTLIDKLVTCNSPQWDDKMYFIMQINLFFFQPVDCHYSSLTGLQNVSTFNKLNTVLIPYHTSILNSVTELKSTVKVGLSSTG